MVSNISKVSSTGLLTENTPTVMQNENLQIINISEIRDFSEDAFVELHVELSSGRSLALRRSLKDSSLFYINRESAEKEEFFMSIANDYKTPQTVVLDGGNVVLMRKFTAEHWLSWVKNSLDLVDSLDRAFGQVLDVSEREKRRAASSLDQIADNLKHMGKCIEIEKQMLTLKAIKAEREFSGLKDYLKHQNFEHRQLLQIGRLNEKKIQLFRTHKMIMMKDIGYENIRKSVAEVRKVMSEHFSLEERNDGDEIEELKSCLEDIKSYVTSGIQEFLVNRIIPDKESKHCKRKFLEICLQFSRIKSHLEEIDGLNDYQELETCLTKRITDLEQDLSRCETNMEHIWRFLHNDIHECKKDLRVFEEHRKKIKAKEATINNKLDIHYGLHLTLLMKDMKEDLLWDEMIFFETHMDIDREILDGVAFIDSLVDHLKDNDELPFAAENYIGPLYKYFKYTSDTNEAFLLKFSHILKPLYTTILVKTAHDAKELLDLAKDRLMSGLIRLDILALEMLQETNPFDIQDMIPGHVNLYDNLVESPVKDVLKRILMTKVYSETSERYPGVTVVNQEGDFVDERGAIGGGSYINGVSKLDEYIKRYLNARYLIQNIREEKQSIMENIEISSRELDRDRLELEAILPSVKCTREIIQGLSALHNNCKDVLHTKKVLQKTVDELVVIKHGMVLVREKKLDSKQSYEKKLDEIMEKALCQEDSLDKDHFTFIGKLYSDIDRLDELIKKIEFNCYDSVGTTFLCNLMTPMVDDDFQAECNTEKLHELEENFEALNVEVLKVREDIRETEKQKNFQKMNVYKTAELLKKCEVIQHKQMPIESRVKETYANRSRTQIDEELSRECHKFTDLTGHSHVHRVHEKVKADIKNWNSRYKCLTRKLINLSGATSNETLLICDHQFSLQQLKELLTILRSIKFTRNSISYYFAFLLEKSNGHWIDCSSESTKIYALQGITGLKWIVRADEDVTEFEEVSWKEQDLCSLAINFAMCAINDTSTFVIDLNDIRKSSQCTEEDLTSLLYSIINHHQAIIISQQPIINDMFRNISVE
ncbi:chromosome partition protein Smc-like [Phlebotomus argentipes]|uniref:chromosome partition protein Smc-like n=1 Tax=Phlebotomus argentipes TaxID=94469 RepID=UPI002892A468|nr:chromosome partition protein Smc-like [Phlebotomus argentipes]